MEKDDDDMEEWRGKGKEEKNNVGGGENTE